MVKEVNLPPAHPGSRGLIAVQETSFSSPLAGVKHLWYSVAFLYFLYLTNKRREAGQIDKNFLFFEKKET